MKFKWGKGKFHLVNIFLSIKVVHDQCRKPGKQSTKREKIPLTPLSRETDISLCIYIYVKGVEKNSASCHVTSIACIGSILWKPIT